MLQIYFRHSKIRDHQKAMINDVYSALVSKSHLLAHAPCGIGKTDGVLSPAITYALENNLDIFFLTPKISQHKIAAEVAKELVEKYALPLRAADIVGRQHSCIHPVLSDLDQDSFYTSCEKLRKEEKCPYYSRAKGNTALEKAKADFLYHKIISDYAAVKNHLALIAECESLGVCPYEIMLKLSSNSRLIIADYFHILAPHIRALFFSKSKKKLENSIVIIDEAHNLPKRIRDYLSVSFNTRMIARMEKEMKAMGGELKFEKEFVAWAEEMLGNQSEMLVEAEQFNSALAYFAMRPEEIEEYFESLGIAYIEKYGRKSALFKFSRFLKGWFDETPGSIRMLRGNKNFFSISKRLLDPAIITAELNKTHSTILISGTLQPLEMFRDILGLDATRTIMKSYPSPFPRENRLNLIVDGITTRYSQRTPTEYAKIAKIIDEVHAIRGKTAAFFPSYSVLNSVLPFLKSTPKFVQSERMSTRELHKLAKDFSSQGGLLLAVQGGSLSEGVDFSNGEIETAIVVGIALEEMTLEVKALIDYYEEKFGKGWEYAYIYPAIMRALQAAGRAIRKESDRAVIIYLDERFHWKNYRKLFPSDERFVIVREKDMLNYLLDFWKHS